MERLQQATRMLVEGDGKDTLPALAGIAVENDAVARVAHRYGLFRRCSAYREAPEIQRIMRGHDPLPRLVRRPDGKVTSDLAPPRARPPAILVGAEMSHLASKLVPPGSMILRRETCAMPGAAPACALIALEPGGAPTATRRASFLRRAMQQGWRVISLSDRRRGVLVLRRGDYEAVIWVTSPGCEEQLGDGPNRQPTSRRCVDTIMVKAA